jgi:hypothetical protein
LKNIVGIMPAHFSPVSHINLPDSPCVEVFRCSGLPFLIFFCILSDVFYGPRFYFLVPLFLFLILCFIKIAGHCKLQGKTDAPSSTRWIKASPYSCPRSFPKATCGIFYSLCSPYQDFFRVLA